MKVINLIVRAGKEGMRGMAHFGVGSLKKGFVEGRARGSRWWGEEGGGGVEEGGSERIWLEEGQIERN